MEINNSINVQIERNSTRKVVKMYGNSASIHGVGRILEPQIFKNRKYVWAVLLLAVSIGLTTFLFRQFSRYSTYPVVTSIRAEFDEDFSLPDITICNANQFHRDRIPNETLLYSLLFNMSDLNYLQYQMGHTRFTRSAEEYNGTMLRLFAFDAAHRVNDMFLLCQWKNKVINCSDYLERRFTDVGLCFTITSKSNSLKAVPLESVTDPSNNLRFLINIEQDKYFFSTTSQAGIKVQFHEPDSEPLPLYQGFFVQPGTATTVSLTINKNKWLPKPYKAFGSSYCEIIDETANKIDNSNYIYTKLSCVMQCVRKYMYNQCKCHNFISSGIGPFCSLEQIRDCYLPIKANLTHKKIWEAGCNCPTPCQTTEYHHSLSVANFASTFTKQYLVQSGIVNSVANIDDNIIDLRINYRSASVTVKDQRPELTVEDIIGNLGGQLGLFIGASVLSLLELVEFLILYLYEWYHSRKKCKTSQQSRH